MGGRAIALLLRHADARNGTRRVKHLTTRLVLAVFLVLQLADGLITFQAVAVFGPLAEGNPLLAAWIAILGPGPALLGAKLVACGCATFLYQAGYHRVIAGLATVYMVVAVGPWLHVLTVLAHQR
ncbi:MAG: hypothetical protein V7647_2489 [Acidobacteriota bacterium]